MTTIELGRVCLCAVTPPNTKRNGLLTLACSVSEEWLILISKGKTGWKNKQWEGKHLDKDILFEGNKVYSPDTCIFVTPTVNTFTTDCGAARGEWLIGADWHKQAGKFRARPVSPPFTKREYLGYFTCEQQAHTRARKTRT